jgi:Rrf2 family iron-sulfur cluster assembly transcriptional regulator
MPLNASQISEREGISVPYANKVLHILRGAGLIESVRGVNGGFHLARPANEITLADIMKAMDSFLFEKNLCASFTGNLKACVHYSGSCTIRAVWNVLMGEVRYALTNTTLDELTGAREHFVAEMMRKKLSDRARENSELTVDSHLAKFKNRKIRGGRS